jgi:hypothetical protein
MLGLVLHYVLLGSGGRCIGPLLRICSSLPAIAAAAAGAGAGGAATLLPGATLT